MAIYSSINTQSRARMRRANDTRDYINSLKEKSKNDDNDEYYKQQLAEKKLRHDRKAMASNPNTSADKLLELLRLDDYDITVKVLANPNCPLNVLKEYAKSKDYYLRKTVAGNNSITNELKETLSRDKTYNVRAAVATLDSIPKEMIERLAKDEDHHVRVSIAGRADISKDMLNTFINDKHLSVKLTAALNNKFSFDELVEFAKKDDDFHCCLDKIAKDEEEDPEKLDKLVGIGYFISLNLIRNRNTPIKTLGKMLNSNTLEIASKVKKRLIDIATYRSLTPEEARELAKIDNRKVLLALSNNSTCPKEVLKELSKNPKLTLFSKSLRKFKKLEKNNKVEEDRVVVVPKSKISYEDLDDGPSYRSLK